MSFFSSLLKIFFKSPKYSDIENNHFIYHDEHVGYHKDLSKINFPAPYLTHFFEKVDYLHRHFLKYYKEDTNNYDKLCNATKLIIEEYCGKGISIRNNPMIIIPSSTITKNLNFFLKSKFFYKIINKYPILRVNMMFLQHITDSLKIKLSINNDDLLISELTNELSYLLNQTRHELECFTLEQAGTPEYILFKDLNKNLEYFELSFYNFFRSIEKNCKELIVKSYINASYEDEYFVQLYIRILKIYNSEELDFRFKNFVKSLSYITISDCRLSKFINAIIKRYLTLKSLLRCSLSLIYLSLYDYEGNNEEIKNLAVEMYSLGLMHIHCFSIKNYRDLNH